MDKEVTAAGRIGLTRLQASLSLIAFDVERKQISQFV